MQLRIVNENIVQVFTPEQYEFHPRDYPLVYRQLVDLYTNNKSISIIQYDSRDVNLIQIIVIQLLLEPDIDRIRPNNVLIRQSLYPCSSLHFLHTSPYCVYTGPYIIVECVDGNIFLRYHLIVEENKKYRFCEPFPFRDGIFIRKSLRCEYNKCLFDSYRELFQGMLETNPHLKITLDNLRTDISNIIMLCAVLTFDNINLECDIPYNSLGLISGAKLKTLYILSTSQPALGPFEVYRSFPNDLYIENLVLSPNGNNNMNDVLLAFVSKSQTRRRVRLNLRSYDKTLYAGLFCNLFREENLNLTAIVIELADIGLFDEASIVHATCFMKRLCDFHIQGKTDVCSLIWRTTNTCIEKKEIYYIVRSWNGNFDKMLDYMWEIYKSVYDQIVLNENGYYEVGSFLFKSDADRETIVQWDVLDLLRVEGVENDVYPIIQEKERFRAIVKRTFHDNISMTRMFKYVYRYKQVFTRHDEFIYLHHALCLFFRGVPDSDMTDKFFVKELREFYFVKDKLNLLARVASMNNPVMMEPFTTTGYGEDVVEKLISLLNHN